MKTCSGASETFISDTSAPKRADRQTHSPLTSPMTYGAWYGIFSGAAARRSRRSSHVNYWRCGSSEIGYRPRKWAGWFSRIGADLGFQHALHAVIRHVAHLSGNRKLREHDSGRQFCYDVISPVKLRN